MPKIPIPDANPYRRRLLDALRVRRLVDSLGQVDYKLAADEIAHFSGEPMDGPTLRRYVTGERLPRLDKAEQIARGLRVPASFWFID
jgi:transcriptional regulator with XRE-family HTH domain